MESLSSDDLLHPEILSKETLIGILTQRQIKLDPTQHQDKELLVDIFHRTVTPLAQREPRLNRRGKVTAKKIKRLSHDKKTFKLDESNSLIKKETQRGGLVISANVPSSKPRLKPPPVVINKKRGIIKLNSSSSSAISSKKASSPPVQDVNSNKSSVIKLSTSSSKSSLEGSVAKITLNSPKLVSESKKISLKRPSSEVSSPVEMTTAPATSTSSSLSGDETSASTSPKKRKKITWP